MKVISLLQPWASLVVLGHKKIETRSFNTKYRGTLLIHSSKSNKFVKSTEHSCQGDLIDELDKLNMLTQDDYDYPYGTIIGQVELLDTFQFTNANEVDEQIRSFLTDKADEALWKEMAFGDFTEKRFGWVLAKPIVFTTPIPAKGQLGFWNYDHKSAQ